MLFVVILCQISFHISTTKRFFAVGILSLLLLAGFVALTNTNVPTAVASIAAAPMSPSALAVKEFPIQLKGSNCDKIFHSGKSKNGTIQSPLFPGPYPVRSFCRYEFQGQGKQRVQIKFFEFSLPSEGDSYNCEDADTLQIFIPIRGRYEHTETLCGETMPKPIMSNGPKMLLEFRGRQSGKGNRGFKAEYKFVENFGIISGQQLPNVECSFAFNSTTEKSGWFHSPNFPGIYPKNIECNYYFYGLPNEKVFIRFTYFDVEGIFPCEESSASDYVEFSNFMSTDRKFRKICGKNENINVRSDGRFFRITFHTNDRFDKTGFRASYVFEAEMATTEATSQKAEMTGHANGISYYGNPVTNLLSLSIVLISRTFVCSHIQNNHA